jgi:hypothetical protein
MAQALSKAEATRMLKAIGFDNAGRAFTTAVKGFQRGCNLGAKLEVDGVCGPLTSDALRLSFARHRQGKGTISAHFSYSEFRCKCGGRFADCQRIWVRRVHVRRLESYRSAIDRSVLIISGCRCKGRNSEVGGVKFSQHMYGVASDIEGRLTLSQRMRLELFAGLGFKGSTGKVIHVDSRDKGGHNSGGSPTAPATWKYAS